MERLMFFFVFILLSIHIFACLWIFMASFRPERNWLTLKHQAIEGAGEAIGGNMQTYFISLYFVTQTFTTVGYGDISAADTAERGFSVLLMLIGVFTFSFASGSLASIMQNVDS
jgi:voltage-gated potassium channel Kch